MRIELLAALVAGVIWLGPSGTALAGTVRVAMAPISVNSASSETAYLSKGLADMIAARLEQSGEVAIVRVGDAPVGRAAAVEAGREAGADFVLYGSYTQFGEGASLDLRCVPVAAVEGDRDFTPRRVFVQAGSPAEIIPKLDELATRITRYLIGAAGSTAQPPASAVPAASPAASIAAVDSHRDLDARIEALERVVFSKPGIAAQGSAAAD